MYKSASKTVALIFIIAVASLAARAQEHDAPKVEVGTQFSSLSITPPGLGGTENATGFGGRVTYNFNDHVAVEAEGNFYTTEQSQSYLTGGRAEQVQAWTLFERDIRSLAEMGRQRTRYLMALRDPGDKLPLAGDVFNRLAEEDRRRSDAATDAKRHFDALYALLDDTQRRMIDRRVVLSQTEPLGSEAAAKR